MTNLYFRDEAPATWYLLITRVLQHRAGGMTSSDDCFHNIYYFVPSPKQSYHHLLALTPRAGAVPGQVLENVILIVSSVCQLSRDSN